MHKVLTILLLAACLSALSQTNIRLRSVLPYVRPLSNVWGYVDSSGTEYALVGWWDGVSIVDVTNPDSIREVFNVPGPTSPWREIKTWNHHLYATNENGSGLLIADLSTLPDSVDYHYWTADTLLNTAHTLFIDEKGFLYLFGYNDLRKSLPSNQRGFLICDLTPDPENPVVVGKYNTFYVHDGYARNDTLWAAQIHNGDFAVLDVSDKDSIVILAQQETPGRTTHNCWLSDDGKYLFTTDERSGAFITSYDVTDLANITEIDRYQAAPGSMLIPHNTHFLNNYLINAYYKYGMNILDATLPDNLVEVAHYDTSPFPNGDGFKGCWGVYPYFPSGTILASDMETGLYVLTPDYQRACYLVGNVMYADTAIPVNGVSVEIMTTNSIKTTNPLGEYRTGIGEPGAYDVRFYKEGCLPKIIAGVELERGIVDTLNVALTCTTLVSTGFVESHRVMFDALPSVFKNQTVLRYKTPEILKTSQVSIQIFDHHGRMRVEISLDDSEGEIVIGNSLLPGIYLAMLRMASVVKVLRVVKV